MQAEVPEFATVTELTRITGFSRPTVEKHIRKGRLTPRVTGKLEEYSFDEFYLEMTENQKGDNNRLRSPSRERKTDLECEIIKLKIDESLGRLVEIEIVGEEMDKVFSSIRQKLLTIPAKLAVRLSAKKTPAQIQKIITKEIHGVLNELSDYTPKKGSLSKKGRPKRKTSKTSSTPDSKRVGE